MKNQKQAQINPADMIDLSEFTEDELVAEIERRKRGIKPQMRSLGPYRALAIDMTKLCEVCQEYIDYVDSADYHADNDWEYWICSAALKTFFGDDVYEWINKRG